MNTSKRISLARITALLTFIGGTLIFLLFYFTNDSGVCFLGLGYIIIMTIVNLIVLLRLPFKEIKNKVIGNTIYKSIVLIILNIPIAITYCWFAMTLLNTVRITFVNTTQIDIDNLQISGCEEKYIHKLLSGESRTIWIKIPSDCGVSIDYKMNGQLKSESVSGYVTNEGGFIMTFKIATNQKAYDQDL